MNKYIDLAERIASKYDMKPGAIRVALGLLDHFATEHPDQVPGRTITESRYRAFTDSASEEYQAGFSDGFFFADGLVIPDPEPTNAQSIDKLLTEFANLNASCGGEQGDHDLAEFLTARGVKAPGGDDE